MSKVIITRADGGISIMQLIGAAVAAEEVAKWAEVHGAPVDWAEVPDDTALPERDFRGAWAFNPRTNKISIDMDKAVEIRRDQLREDRAKLFEKLDVESLRALENGDAKKQAELAAEKQRLRDLPADPRLAAATLPDHLREVTVSVETVDQ